jgi:AraC-like DNA-binding protein
MIKLKNAFLLNFLLIILSTIYYFSINNVALAVNIGLVILFIQFFYFLIVSIWQNLLIRNDIIQLEHPEQIEQLDLILENIISDNKQPKILVSDEVADKYITIILEIMAKDKPYLQTAYSIQQLAESTDIPLHHISNCLNIRLNKSFTEFINEYRVAVAIELLKDPAYSNLTIEAIALDCGFGSKKSFNTAFKKLTLLTPSEYRK